MGISVAGILLNIGLPDRRHLHHALNRRVPSTRSTVLLLLALSASTAGAALLASVQVLAWPFLLAGPIGITFLLGRLGCMGPARARAHLDPFAAASGPSEQSADADSSTVREDRRAA
jgi:hypothetical protein